MVGQLLAPTTHRLRSRARRFESCRRHLEDRQVQIDEEAALDWFYVLRTPVPASQLDVGGVFTAYKNLKYVERDFRHIKADDLDLRPVTTTSKNASKLTVNYDFAVSRRSAYRS